MSSIGVSLIVFGCVFGGALVGRFLHRVLPEPHLRWDSQEAVKLAMGLVATMSALIVGLLVSSAKSYYDTQSSELSEMSSKVVLLDHVLAHYGRRPMRFGARSAAPSATSSVACGRSRAPTLPHRTGLERRGETDLRKAGQ